jgi:hypothetical protein
MSLQNEGTIIARIDRGLALQLKKFCLEAGCGVSHFMVAASEYVTASENWSKGQAKSPVLKSMIDRARVLSQRGRDRLGRE